MKHTDRERDGGRGGENDRGTQGRWKQEMEWQSDGNKEPHCWRRLALPEAFPANVTSCKTGPTSCITLEGIPSHVICHPEGGTPAQPHFPVLAQEPVVGHHVDRNVCFLTTIA